MPRSIQTQTMAKSILQMLAPFNVEDHKKVRLGRFNDGGYVMIDDFGDIDAVYSFGIKDDVSWDLDIAARGVDVFQYDHTIDALPQNHRRFRWSKIGLASVPQPHLRLETLPTLIDQNGHRDRGNLLLKCDIEGAEWAVFESLQREDLQQFKQIAIELHDIARISDPAFAERARKAVQNMTMLHQVVHVHANNWGDWCILGGISVPDVLEITLVRKGDYTLTPFVGSFPAAIDQPNNPKEPDFYLGNFLF